MARIKGSLSNKIVLERLKLCEDREVVNEIYDFGQMLLRETLQNLHSLDSKAAWMAGYGAAIITLLVSSTAAWATLGNKWTVGIAVLAGISSFVGAFFAVNSLSLQRVDWIGDEEWLEKDCLASVWKLKRYRIFIMSGTINSIDEINSAKGLTLRKAQWGLSVSVGFLLAMLLHLGWLRVLRDIFWLKIGGLTCQYPLYMSGWENFLSSASSYNYSLNLSLYLGTFGNFGSLILRSIGFVWHVGILSVIKI